MTRTSSQEKAVTKRRSLIVTAGAGTGKTTVLVDRYIHLMDQTGSVKKILALTFTEKAAAEMKERARTAISSHVSEERNAQEMRDDFNWASIYTFHSFCTNILRDYPLESGIDPDFTVLDDAGRGAVLNEALEELYRSPSEELRPALVRLASLTEPWRLSQFLLTLYDKRFSSTKLFGELLAGDAEKKWREESEAQRAAALKEIMDNQEFSAAISALADLSERHSGDADAGTRYLKDARPLLDAIRFRRSMDQTCSAILSIHDLKGSRSMGNKNNFKPDDLSHLRESYGIVRDVLDSMDLPGILSIEDDQYISYAVGYLRDLSAVFKAFEKLVLHVKRERNCIDFEDMLIAVHRLFDRDKEFVRKHFGERYRYILVDEMQDTDVIQLDIIRALIEASDNRLDKLFVVGDPKQSIYLFRDVDVSLFKETRAFVTQALSGEPINLDVNFRSTPQVVSFVNYLFAQLMKTSDRPWEFCYEGMACSEQRSGDKGSVELILLPCEMEGTARKLAEAKMVVDEVQELCSAGRRQVYWDGHTKRAEGRTPKYGDICILLRSRTNLRFYKDALQRSGVPFHVHAGIGFYSSQEVLDAYNLLRFLNDKFDDVALYGLLRSPYVGLSDAELFRMFFGGHGPLIFRLKEHAEKKSDPSAAAILHMLERWHERGQREPMSDVLHRIVSDSSICAVYGGMDGGEQMISNLEKLFQMILEWQGTGYMGLPKVVETLGANIRDEMKEGDAQTDFVGRNAVSIMTVHAAKGLEFSIVIVPEIDTKPKADTGYVAVDREFGIGVKIPDPASLDLRPTPQMKKIETRLKEKGGAERKRLFYVAATRAKDHLVLSGKRTKGADGLDKAMTWMDLLEHGLGITDEAESKGRLVIEGDDGKDVEIMIRNFNRSVPEKDYDTGPREFKIPAWMIENKRASG